MVMCRSVRVSTLAITGGKRVASVAPRRHSPPMSAIRRMTTILILALCFAWGPAPSHANGGPDIDGWVHDHRDGESGHVGMCDSAICQVPPGVLPHVDAYFPLIWSRKVLPVAMNTRVSRSRVLTPEPPPPRA